MQYNILINDTFKKYLLRLDRNTREIIKEKIEFLQNGLWDSGLKVKKLKSLSNKVVFEARVDRANRILFTLGKDNFNAPLIYLWGVVAHDEISRKAEAIIPSNAPFLNFESYNIEEYEEVEIDKFSSSYYTQEHIEQKIYQESGPQRWYLLTDEELRRIMLYSKDEFEIFLYLTKEQADVCGASPPVLLSGTAGSGKTTISVYYLLKKEFYNSKKIYITYNEYLKNFAKKIYYGLINNFKDEKLLTNPQFFTFKEILYKIVPPNIYPPQNEVDVFTFSELFNKHPLSNKYDYALVWEEIRSIIKGAKPQFEIKTLESYVNKVIFDIPGEIELKRLKEYLISLGNLSIGERIEGIIKKYLNISFDKFIKNLQDLLLEDKEQRSRVITSLNRIMDVISRERSIFTQDILTLFEYENLGRKRAPYFVHKRDEIYEIVKWYQDILIKNGLFDEIDLTRKALSLIDKTKDEFAYDLVVCDEAQDLTNIQIELLFKLLKNRNNIFISADQKQIINPSGFRWEEVKSFFYEKDVSHKFFSLSINFRSSGSIVKLANEILKIKQQLLGSSKYESFEEWKFQGRPPFLLFNLSDQDILKNTISGADRAIIVRSEIERDKLKNILKTELIYTIKEAKGLEFNTVLLWKFLENEKISRLWEKMLNNEGILQEAQIRYELNLLYVATTRAQQNLIIYEGKDKTPLWLHPYLADLIIKSSDVSYISELFNRISTRQEWKEHGDYLFERKFFIQSAECYKNADEEKLYCMSMALHYEHKKEYEMSAEFYFKIEDYKKAGENFESGGNFEKAVECYRKINDKDKIFELEIHLLEKRGMYDLAAERLENLGNYKRAIENWHKANRYDKLVPLYLKFKMYDKLTDAYLKLNEYELAANIFYKKLKKYELAGAYFEKANKYQDALKIWKKLKKEEKIIECLEQLQDYYYLAQFYEKKKDIKNVIKYLGLSLQINQIDNNTISKEIEDFIKKRKYLYAGVRAFVIGRWKEAGDLLFQAKEYELALKAYQNLNSIEKIARCYERLNEYYKAAEFWLKSEIIDDIDKEYLALNNLKNFLHNNREARKIIKKDAEFFLNSNEYNKASIWFKAIDDFSRAGDCYFKSGNFDNAIDSWNKAKDYEKIYRFFNETKKYQDGLKFFEELRKYEYIPVFCQKILEENPDNLICWEKLKRCALILDYPSDIIDFMEKNKKYFYVWQILLNIRQYEKDGIARIKNEIKINEKENKFIEAGIRYLVIGEEKKALEYLKKFEMDDEIALCLGATDEFQKSVDWFLDKNINLSIRILLAHREFEQLLNIFLAKGMEQEGVSIFEKEKQYQLAVQLYERSNLQEKTGFKERYINCLIKAKEWEKLHNYLLNDKRYNDIDRLASKHKRFREFIQNYREKKFQLKLNIENDT